LGYNRVPQRRRRRRRCCLLFFIHSHLFISASF
jgi:hypothetical protein